MPDSNLEYRVKLRAESGAISEARIYHDAARKDHRLILELDGERLIGEGYDYWDGFCNLRKELARRKLIPLCYGASKNVFPSGMSRDMGGGLTAYKTIIGQPGGELVGIFDRGDDIEPVDVETQALFHREWFESVCDNARITKTGTLERLPGILGYLKGLFSRSRFR